LGPIEHSLNGKISGFSEKKERKKVRMWQSLRCKVHKPGSSNEMRMWQLEQSKTRFTRCWTPAKKVSNTANGLLYW